MIVRTDAVVLRTLDYGETSQIVALFTREHGLLSVIAKGSRRPKSRFGSTLQPLAYVQAVYYFREGRGLQTLKETAHVQRFSTLPLDLDRLTRGMRMLELVRALFEEGEPNPAVFNLLLRGLHWLDTEPPRPANGLCHVQLRLATLLGFAPDVRREDLEALPEHGGVLRLDDGSIAPPEAASKAGLRASRAALRAFAIFARTDLGTSARLALDDATRDETERLVDAYLRTHVGDGYPTRVPKVARQLS
ncbi:MAG: DNA repair protein RecO [Bacteroidota bacterium]